MDRREFVLHYQPIIDLSTGSMVAVEALARWKHPESGLLLPYHFIPLAEQTGIILPLGLLLVEEACRDAAAWHRPGTLDAAPLLNVNLSPRHLQQADLVQRIESLLRTTGLPASGLQLELTESVRILDVHEAATALRGLKDLGVRIAIDDFGAGYSSLARLHAFEIDTLKVDQSFISAISPSGGSWKIVHAIISLAHALGMIAVAEGIETAEQLEQVRATGCDLGQGYYFYQPMPLDELEPLLHAGPRRD